MKNIVACIAGGLLLIGCGPMVMPVPDGPNPGKPIKESVWTVLADYVDAGEVTDSSKLELVVKRLRSHGDIDDAAVERFYAVFPGIKDKEIAVSKGDSSKLRGI